MDDLFYTIATPSKIEIKRKASRFIGEAVLVQSPEEATASLASVRKREHAATHHCFAWRCGLEPGIEFKYSDDGEPNGTAGRPIYDALCGRDVTNALVVVTRYYGGTKLGTGGLVRAYGDAAREALVESGRKENLLVDRVAVEIEFPLYDLLMKTVAKHEARKIAADFSDRVKLEIESRRSRTDNLIADIVQLSSGKAKIEKL